MTRYRTIVADVTTIREQAIEAARRMGLIGVATRVASKEPMEAGGICGRHGLFIGRACPECEQASREQEDGER